MSSDEELDDVPRKMDTKTNLLLNSLKSFYRQNDRFDTLKEILTKKAVVSLRMLDWYVVANRSCVRSTDTFFARRLVTNYARKVNIVYELNDHDGYTTSFNLFLS